MQNESLETVCQNLMSVFLKYTVPTIIREANNPVPTVINKTYVRQ